MFHRTASLTPDHPPTPSPPTPSPPCRNSSSSGARRQAVLFSFHSTFLMFPPNVSRCAEYARLAHRPLADRRQKMRLSNAGINKMGHAERRHARRLAGSSRRPGTRSDVRAIGISLPHCCCQAAQPRRISSALRVFFYSACWLVC